jgi:glycosyltransferase involved in cell wall biosynthesis
MSLKHYCQAKVVINCDMGKPLVSIIVPVYNTAEYVEECIQSILSQSYKNTELILVNDGSTDESGEICKKYEHLQNVIYIENAHQGVVEARKQGVEKASGEWVMFVDSDDLLLDDAICKMVAFSDGCNIVIGRHHDNMFLLNAPDRYCWDEYLYILYSHTGIWASPWGKLFRKKIINDSPLAFFYKIERSEDFLMNIAIAFNNRLEVGVCKDEIYFYRKRPSSTIRTNLFSCDYCYHLCNIADSIVKEAFPPSKFITGGISMRLYYYRRILKEHDYQGYGRHPLARQTIYLMNKARILNLKDRILLSLTNRRGVKAFLYLLKFNRLLRLKCSKILRNKK